jgi:large subunit ribosomal protein L11e
MDFYIVLKRPGARVARRRARTGRVGSPHKISKEQAIKWFQKKYEGIVN